MTRTIRSCVTLLVLVVGCAGEEAPPPDKQQIATLSKADWPVDYCAEYGWYGDGVCDDFCPEPDPDCDPCWGAWLDETGTCRTPADGVYPAECCVAECPPVLCTLYCEHGFKRDAAGCETCECEEAPRRCGGFADSPTDCAADEYCDWADDVPFCGSADHQGTCRKRPEACSLEIDPVCGCDGTTHSNACFAAIAGQDVAYPGACAEPPTP